MEWLQTFWPKALIWGPKPLVAQSRWIHARSRWFLARVSWFSDECLRPSRHFSTEFFMYAEEADFCAKVQKAGWKSVILEPLASCTTAERSTRQLGSSSHVAMRNSVFQLLRKFRGPAYAYCYRVILFSAAARLILLTPFAVVIPERLLLGKSTAKTMDKWWHIASWSLSMKAAGLGWQ